ncbi:efflux RND transporter periplasmic adaptor subunit [Roseovarius sp. D22-M7]|uniref:efflux RND transporter periplasmic adaptor subunit n=1 Tax=Roseovarius sp. D22-M7 TaxID=3127116 RepID=UPI00300FD72E
MAVFKRRSVAAIRAVLLLFAMALAPGMAPPALAQSGGTAGTEAVTVDLARAARAETTRTRDFVGRLAPLKVVDLAFQVSGQIHELPVTNGQMRDEGALIARLDTVDFELALENARATYDLAEIEFNRAAELADRGTAAQSRLDQVRADRAQARIALREAERRLDQATITAPFDALVARVIAEPFINTTPSQPVVRLQDVSEMRVIVSLPEEIAALARADGRNFVFSATFPAASGYEASLTLREFVTEADPVAQTYEVEFAVTGEVDPRLLPGMTAKVSGRPATGSGAPPVVVPVEAIDTTSGTDPRVWVFDPESATVAPRNVILGLPRDGNVVVLDGLETGDRVVSAGWTGLTEGARVRPSGG